MVSKYGAADHVTTMGFVTSTAVQSILESMAENRTLHDYVVNVMTPQAAELAVEIGVSPDVELYNNSVGVFGATTIRSATTIRPEGSDSVCACSSSRKLG